MIFQKNMWREDDFFHTSIYEHSYRKRFIQLDDCITNGMAPAEGQSPNLERLAGGMAPEDIPGLDRNMFCYTSYTLKTRVSPPCAFSSTFSFDDFGSPAFYYANDVVRCGELYILGSHIEVVAWEKGLNFWLLEAHDNTHSVKLLRAVEFRLAANEKHTIHVSLDCNGIVAQIQDRSARVDFPMYKNGYVGFIGCEGINRFYDFSADMPAGEL